MKHLERVTGRHYTRVGACILVAAAIGVASWVSPAAFSQEIERDVIMVSNKVIPGGFLEPARMMRADGWEWEHEVRVWLPPTYHATTRTYPTLWVTDNGLEVVQAGLVASNLGYAPEIIIVSVGAPADIDAIEHQRRRSYDFVPDASIMGGTFLAVPETVGGAEGFLDFLVKEVRPKLAAEYRMDPDEHGLAGHSGGAMFGLYVLFNKPESFGKYIISSPADGPWLELEQAYFREHRDIAARVFLSAGEAEMTDLFMATSKIVSTVATLVERITTRNYRSLELDARIIPGEGHGSVMPVAYTRGIRSLWAERLPKRDMQALMKLLQELQPGAQQQAE